MHACVGAPSLASWRSAWCARHLRSLARSQTRTDTQTAPRTHARCFTAQSSSDVVPTRDPALQSVPADEPDLAGIPVQHEAFMRRAHRVLSAISGRDTDTAKMKEMRKFWLSRTTRYCNLHDADNESWSARNILSSVTARKVPSGMAKRYFIFTSFVALSFESVKSMDPSDWMFHDLIEYMTRHQEALTKPVGFLATALFLMASFRLNRATSRWWQARILWGDLHADVRSFVSPPPSLLPPEPLSRSPLHSGSGSGRAPVRDRRASCNGALAARRSLPAGDRDEAATKYRRRLSASFR